MLQYYNPTRVATDFHLLEAMFPDRIDLGVSGNIVPDPDLHRRLFDGRESNRAFSAQIGDLIDSLRVEGTLPQKAVASIRGLEAPELWACGLSESTARVAGETGSRFAYSPYFGQFTPTGTAVDMVQAYRRSFRPVTGLDSLKGSSRVMGPARNGRRMRPGCGSPATGHSLVSRDARTVPPAAGRDRRGV